MVFDKLCFVDQRMFDLPMRDVTSTPGGGILDSVQRHRGSLPAFPSNAEMATLRTGTNKLVVSRS